MKKTLSPIATNALKEALTHIYWYKNDLKSFLTKSLPKNILLGYLDFDNSTKREIASIVVDRLFELNKHEELLQLAKYVCELNSFEHLKHLENAETKIINAKNSINQLRIIMAQYQENEQEKIIKDKKRKENQEKIMSFKNYQEQLNLLKDDFFQLMSKNLTAQQKGFKLEKIMNELFSLNDLDPKSSFKVIGEQIDGAFTLDNTEFLFEAKWVSNPINKAELAVFKDKVKTKLENTLGLFLSINGFSEDGLIAFQAQDKVVILMDGSDLMAILEDRISFPKLINRKKQIASREGKIFVPFYQMIKSTD